MPTLSTTSSSTSTDPRHPMCRAILAPSPTNPTFTVNHSPPQANRARVSTTPQESLLLRSWVALRVKSWIYELQLD
ncbi:unnamed protein product [Sphenostylis stenocarpa]|uniref:Uncharacterized protein n=1 Tax=Sphenostylis stenocarpa TaxID=92480 RepID=A0AA86SN22_9FABA|nr:unnamed protein product [Sphenostylis stenocarpa]